MDATGSSGTKPLKGAYDPNAFALKQPINTLYSPSSSGTKPLKGAYDPNAFAMLNVSAEVKEVRAGPIILYTLYTPFIHLYYHIYT